MHFEPRNLREGERVAGSGSVLGTVLLALAVLGVPASTVGRALWVAAGVALVGIVFRAIWREAKVADRVGPQPGSGKGDW